MCTHTQLLALNSCTLLHLDSYPNIILLANDSVSNIKKVFKYPYSLPITHSAAFGDRFVLIDKQQNVTFWKYHKGEVKLKGHSNLDVNDPVTILCWNTSQTAVYASTVSGNFWFISVYDDWCSKIEFRKPGFKSLSCCPADDTLFTLGYDDGTLILCQMSISGINIYFNLSPSYSNPSLISDTSSSSAIVMLSFHPTSTDISSQTLAVLRSNATIQIWNIKNKDSAKLKRVLTLKSNVSHISDLLSIHWCKGGRLVCATSFCLEVFDLPKKSSFTIDYSLTEFSTYSHPPLAKLVDVNHSTASAYVLFSNGLIASYDLQASTLINNSNIKFLESSAEDFLSRSHSSMTRSQLNSENNFNNHSTDPIASNDNDINNNINNDININNNNNNTNTVINPNPTFNTSLDAVMKSKSNLQHSAGQKTHKSTSSYSSLAFSSQSLRSQIKPQMQPLNQLQQLQTKEATDKFSDSHSITNQFQPFNHLSGSQIIQEPTHSSGILDNIDDEVETTLVRNSSTDSKNSKASSSGVSRDSDNYGSLSRKGSDREPVYSKQNFIPNQNPNIISNQTIISNHDPGFISNQNGLQTPNLNKISRQDSLSNQNMNFVPKSTQSYISNTRFVPNPKNPIDSGPFSAPLNVITPNPLKQTYTDIENSSIDSTDINTTSPSTTSSAENSTLDSQNKTNSLVVRIKDLNMKAGLDPNDKEDLGELEQDDSLFNTNVSIGEIEYTDKELFPLLYHRFESHPFQEASLDDLMSISIEESLVFIFFGTEYGSTLSEVMNYDITSKNNTDDFIRNIWANKVDLPAFIEFSNATEGTKVPHDWLTLSLMLPRIRECQGNEKDYLVQLFSEREIRNRFMLPLVTLYALNGFTSEALSLLTSEDRYFDAFLLLISFHDDREQRFERIKLSSQLIIRLLTEWELRESSNKNYISTQIALKCRQAISLMNVYLEKLEFEQERINSAFEEGDTSKTSIDPITGKSLNENGNDDLSNGRASSGSDSNPNKSNDGNSVSAEKVTRVRKPTIFGHGVGLPANPKSLMPIHSTSKLSRSKSENIRVNLNPKVIK